MSDVLAEVAKASTPLSPPTGEVQRSIAHYERNIQSWLSEPDMTAKQIWRLLKELGNIFSYTSVKRYVKKLNPDTSRPSTIRLETPSAEQAQVDFGRVTLNLGDTRKGVVKADLYDPTINRAYGELERHYGFVADPAKVMTPEHKGKVERSMPTVRQQLIAGRQYKDLADANEKALTWTRTGIGMEKHGTTHEEPKIRFDRDEKGFLIPLPSKHFEIPLWKDCVVHPDHHVGFDKSYYSVPTKYVGKKVWVRGTFRMTEIFLNQELIKCHVRASQARYLAHGYERLSR